MKLKILNNNYYLTLEDYYFTYKWNTYKIPEWFYWDWWSIPRIVWFISHPVMKPYVDLFLIHDWMYSNKCEIDMTRKEADEFFAYQVLHFSIIKWILFYIAVRLFWWFSFKKPLQFNKKDYI